MKSWRDGLVLWHTMKTMFEAKASNTVTKTMTMMMTMTMAANVRVANEAKTRRNYACELAYFMGRCNNIMALLNLI